MPRCKGSLEPMTLQVDMIAGMRRTKKNFMTKGAWGAVSYRAGSSSAYKIVIGIPKLALEKSLNLQTETPALRLRVYDEDKVQWIVQTIRANVQAVGVLLATNGYIARLHPPPQGIIIPRRGHMTARRPRTSIPQADHPGTYSFIHENKFDYMIIRPRGSKFAGDFILGGGSTKAIHKGLYELGANDDTTIDPVIIDYRQDCSGKYFGLTWGSDDRRGRLRKAWTGIMGRSADNFPFVSHLSEDDSYIPASLQDSGMVLCFSSAEPFVLMMKNRNEELGEWFPKSFNTSEERISKGSTKNYGDVN